MAGVSTKEIKTRIRSMESTKQITKAMEMVAASKLRRAQNQVLCSRPYFEILYATMNDIVDSTRDFSSPYLTKRPVKKSVYVVIAGDRGLAGGYNSNILKLVAAEAEGKDVLILPIGKKAADHFRARGAALLSEKYADAEDVGVGDCFTLAKWLCKGYLNGEYDEIKVAYTNFVSVLSQTPGVLQLLPVLRKETGRGVLYGALCESRASEQAARRTAMESATQNAEDMISDLSLKFNQARQAAITQEITEIVAGS